MNVDGIAYLDMGDAYLRGDWATAVRSHWSPLYGWLLGTALRVVQPSPGFEFPLVHLVNLLIYFCALAAFTFLMYAARVREPLLISIGYAVFVFCTLQYTPLGLVTPDLLVSAVMYVVCAVLLLTRRPSEQGCVCCARLLARARLPGKSPDAAAGHCHPPGQRVARRSCGAPGPRGHRHARHGRMW